MSFGFWWRILTPFGYVEVEFDEAGGAITDPEESDESHQVLMILTSGVENRDPRITKVIVKIYAQFHPEYFPPGISLDSLETRDIDPIRPQLIDFLETKTEEGYLRLYDAEVVIAKVDIVEAVESKYAPQPLVEEQTHFIDVILKDQDGQPVINSRVRITLPDGSEPITSKTNNRGQLRLENLAVGGNAKIELLDFNEAGAAKPIDGPAADEFAVKVVDETGIAVSGVNLVFSGVGTPETVPTGSDGIATYQAATETDAVDVTFESAKSLSDVMKPIWKQRQPATAPEDYVKPSAEITVVASRAKAIETEDGGAFPGFSMKSGTKKTLSVRPTKKRAVFVEMHDSLFRTNSAVVMPAGEAPTPASGSRSSTPTAGFIATVLLYNAECPAKRLLIAGHTDTKGSDQFNQPLSEERAKAVLALLVGDRDAFASLCMNRHDDVDLTQIFHWCADALGLDCKPTRHDTAPSEKTIHNFQESYNFWQSALGADAYPPLAVTGKVDLATWKALFDCYEHHLRWALDEDAPGVSKKRAMLAWADNTHKSIGFGENWPTDKPGLNNRSSQTNRRVEILMFDNGEEPDLADAAANPSTTDLYNGGYVSQRIDPYPAGKKTMWLRIAMSPASATTCQDEFTLSSVDGSLVSTRRVADHHEANAETVDIQFDDLDASLAYELSIQETGMTDPQLLTGKMTANAIALGPDPAFDDDAEEGGAGPSDSSAQVAYV